MALVYLGLGANLNNPLTQLQFAIEQLDQHEQISITACSSMYASKPMGPQDQPDYVNAVVALTTSLLPESLLDVAQQIEDASGRVRLRRWGERTLDLDILLYDELVLETPRLSVPHPGIEQREFVIIPLAEIASQLVLPNGTPIANLATTIARNGLAKIAPAVTI